MSKIRLRKLLRTDKLDEKKIQGIIRNFENREIYLIC